MKFRMKMLVAGGAAALGLAGISGAAFAAEDAQITGSFEDGSYVVRIPGGDPGWFAEDMVGDGTVVKLGSAEQEGDDFVIRFDPVADGEVTVGARHFYTASACDEVHTWDLKVEDGKITETTGGSYTANPGFEELDSVVSGQWTEEAGAVELTVTAGESGMSWDVEAVSSNEEDPYIFMTSICYDCYQDAFVYDKGKFFHVPEEGAEVTETVAAETEEGAEATETEAAETEAAGTEAAEPEEGELGEAYLYGTTGTFRFEGEDEENLKLRWTGDEKPEQEIVFAKAQGGEDWYSGVTAMPKADVEAFAAAVKEAYLKEDWETLAGYIDFPVNVNGETVDDADALLAYMDGAAVAESDRASLEAETCRDMFCNGQGICLGAGSLWLNDLSYMTDKDPELKVIALNGITK